MKTRPKKAAISLRVPSAFWDSDAGFAAFCDFASEYRFVDEYAFFATPLIGTPLPADYLAHYWEPLVGRIEKTREYAPRVGINNLVTIGHCPHNEGHYQVSFAKMVSSKGIAHDWKSCPSNPAWREEYIKPIYTLLAQCHPDFIWIDDDLRLTNFGMDGLGCFCPHCMEQICRNLGFKGGLPELKTFLETGTPEELRQRRLSLLEHNRSVMADISAYIERVVHAVDPKIILGQMDHVSYWEIDSSAQASALSGPENIEVWWRPGGGNYTERCPDEIIVKANCIAAGVAMMPETVTAIQSEIENYYFAVLGKSRRYTSLEAQLYCAAAGCTGTAYSLFDKPAGPVQIDPLSAWEPMVRELKRNEAFIELIVSNNQRLPLKGVWNGIGKNYFLGNNYAAGDWLTKDCESQPRFHPWLCGDLHVLGLPPAFRKEDATVAAIGAREVAAFSDEEIYELLHGGVYMDAPALEAMNCRGFGEYTGFTKLDEFTADAAEMQVEHVLNDCGNLYRRDVIQVFWGSIAYSLAPSAGAQVLGRLVDPMQVELAACSSGTYENRLGGRIAVIGYAPWHGLGYVHKITQVRKIFDWLSGGYLAGRVDSIHRCNLWLRQRPDGGANAAVLNSSMDDQSDISLLLKTPHKRAALHRLDSAPVKIAGVESGNGYMRFTLPQLDSWSLGYLMTE